MTVLDVPPARHRLHASLRSVRRVLPMVGCAMPADVLSNAAVAQWVCGHGVTVTACGDDELSAVLARGVRPSQVTLRCGDNAETLRRAADLGVARFVVATERHVDTLAMCEQPLIHVYLAERGPAVIGERRLDICGMHCDVDGSGGAPAWGAAADRLLGRIALMRTCGLALTRISLAGGTASPWLSASGEVTEIASAVDDALDEGCARWRLPRPAVALAPRHS